MKRMVGIIAIVLVAGVGLISQTAEASPIPITLVGQDYANFSVVGTASAPKTDSYNLGQFAGTVTSQAFNLPNSDYLYLYQVDNTGLSALETLVVTPFLGLTAQGWLTANEPAGFIDTTTGYSPAFASYDSAVPQPVVSFNYPGGMGLHVPAGAHTAVLYLVSSLSPADATGFTIDGGVAAVDIVGTVPEPATAGILAVGGILVLWRKRRKAA